MTDLFAAVDCGTNSVRLLIARASAAGLAEVDRRLFITRLGQGVDATGRFAPEALERTFAAMDDFAAQLGSLGGARTRVVATSAARDAANSAVFFDGVRARFGVDAEIISGAEEAALSYAGAVGALPGLPTPALVMDIGGGSTELALGEPAANVILSETATERQVAGSMPLGISRQPDAGAGSPLAVSLDMGSVRLRERFFASDPPTPAQIEAAEAFADGLLDGSGVPFGDASSWVGVGGTATCLSAIALGLSSYDAAAVHGSTLTRETIDALSDRLLAMPVAEIVKIPTMVPGRADVICAGALICRAVGRRVAGDLRVSEADLLDGIVARLAADGR